MLGMHGTAYANFAISECDLLITLGARFDDRVTGKLDEFACNAQVIHVDIDPAEIGKNRVPQVAIVGDVSEVLAKLLKLLQLEQNNILDHNTSWLERLEYWKKSYPLIIPKNQGKLSPQEVIAEISRQAPDAYYTTDVGQHQMWSAQFIKTRPRRWISSSGLGTMGYGLPAAIGVKVAYTDSDVICISGDSSFQMNLQELATIAQYQLNIKIIIINNSWQGMVRQWQQAFYGGRYSHSNMKKGSPDFCQLALAFGIKSLKISNNTHLIDSISYILNYNGPMLVDVEVIENENCYPMVAPGKSNDQMLGIVNTHTKPQNKYIGEEEFISS